MIGYVTLGTDDVPRAAAFVDDEFDFYSAVPDVAVPLVPGAGGALRIGRQRFLPYRVEVLHELVAHIDPVFRSGQLIPDFAVNSPRA